MLLNFNHSQNWKAEIQETKIRLFLNFEHFGLPRSAFKPIF